MTIENNLLEMSKSLGNLEKSGIYDVEKFSYALLHQTKQLEYFYCQLVKDGNCNDTFYHIKKRPHVHELAYFNIGRGFPKELMDGHWCYILKDLGYKMLVIPCTSIKEDSTIANPQYEKDIDGYFGYLNPNTPVLINVPHDFKCKYGDKIVARVKSPKKAHPERLNLEFVSFE